MELKLVNRPNIANSSNSPAEASINAPFVRDKIYAAANWETDPISECNRLVLDSAAVCRSFNWFAALPFDIMHTLLGDVELSTQANLYATSFKMNQQFPSFVEWDIRTWGERRRNGQKVVINLPASLSSNEGIQFVNSRIVKCGPNKVIKLKKGDLTPEQVKQHYGKVEIELRKRLSTHLSEQEFAVLKKYIGDGLFDTSYFERLLPDQQRQLLDLLLQEKIQKYVDSLALDNEAMNQSIAVKDMLAFVTALSLGNIDELLIKGLFTVRLLSNISEGGLLALQNKIVIRYCENGWITPEEFVVLPLLTAKALCEKFIQEKIFKSDGSVTSCDKSPKKYFIWMRAVATYTTPGIGFILSTKPAVLGSLLDPVVQSHLVVDPHFGDSTRQDFSIADITLFDLLELNKNGHDFIRDKASIDMFKKLAFKKFFFKTIATPGNEVGKKALFEYWHILKDKGICASSIYRFTTPTHRLLLDNGQYDQYVEQIRTIASKHKERSWITRKNVNSPG